MFNNNLTIIEIKNITIKNYLIRALINSLTVLLLNILPYNVFFLYLYFIIIFLTGFLFLFKPINGKYILEIPVNKIIKYFYVLPYAIPSIILYILYKFNNPNFVYIFGIYAFVFLGLAYRNFMIVLYEIYRKKQKYF